MKLAILGDLHIRSTAPENRIDNYKESLFEKLKFVFNIAYEHTVLLPGDVFDGPNQSNAMLIECIELLRNKEIHAIYGQHDMKFRTIGNTALDVLIASEIVENEPLCKLAKSVFLYSCSYNESVPEITTDGFNILLLHEMVIEEKLWDAQTDYKWANTLLRRTKFDLIASGDNHRSFFIDYKGKHLINCGSLMRSSKDQINHKPCYVIYDTDRREYKVYYIPVKPASEVFDMQKIEIEKKRDEKLAAFVDGLIEGEELGLNFSANLETTLNKSGVHSSIVSIIKEAMNCGSNQ